MENVQNKYLLGVFYVVNILNLIVFSNPKEVNICYSRGKRTFYQTILLWLRYSDKSGRERVMCFQKFQNRAKLIIT